MLKFDARLFSRGVAICLSAAGGIFVLGDERAMALESAPGILIENDEFSVIMTDEGYSDLVLDKRPGFEGREYLSGEWAAAICYDGGSNPTEALWLRKEWAFPCWQSNSDFNVTEPVNILSATPNPDGFLIYRSIVANSDVEITMTYQMLDSGTGIQQGEAPASDGGAGSSSLSSHFVFKQTYSVKNLTGGTLSGVQLYQFLHGLESGKSIYDDRDYGGTFGGYRFDNTQIGEDLSFHTETNEVFSHLDTIAMHAQNMPSSHEVGYFGKEGVDDHRNGKPSVGVHLSVEAKALSGEDFFEPPEGRWVSGAMCFDLPDLLPGASAERDVLLSLSTVSTLRFPAPDIHIFTSEFNGDGDFVLEFEDRKEVPVDGYILFKSTDLSGPFPDAWTQLALPRLIDAPHPGASRFTIPIDPGSKRCFFVIQPVFDD